MSLVAVLVFAGLLVAAVALQIVLEERHRRRVERARRDLARKRLGL